VELNEGLLTIGDKAFAETALASVRIPSTVTVLADSPFDGCADLTTMTGPITIDYSNGCFSNCGNLSVFNFTAGTAGGSACEIVICTRCTCIGGKAVNSKIATIDGLRRRGQSHNKHGCQHKKLLHCF
jgi:hypothetical protein